MHSSCPMTIQLAFALSLSGGWETQGQVVMWLRGQQAATDGAELVQVANRTADPAATASHSAPAFQPPARLSTSGREASRQLTSCQSEMMQAPGEAAPSHSLQL